MTALDIKFGIRTPSRMPSERVFLPRKRKTTQEKAPKEKVLLGQVNALEHPRPSTQVSQKTTAAESYTSSEQCSSNKKSASQP
ncbi:hypothetical protein EKO04_008091 [Ascochyta lentis]|uniref:Uncharacterized protein n=1 Tax=Ascochyta lentis TaxID=205686 RepID=A0A8H7IX52_9PLEO|nr:hypothetical protein EKO04_008091 [Ascochyta lentis]